MDQFLGLTIKQITMLYMGAPLQEKEIQYLL